MSASILSNLTLNNANVKDLKELIDVDIKTDEAIQQFTTIQTGVMHGDPIATIGEPDAIGLKGAGCNPTYTTFGVANAKQTWALGEWSAPHKICYEDMLGTYAQLAMKKGVNIADLTGTDVMEIFEDKFKTALLRAIWRMGWFGDTSAATVTNSGVITNGTDVNLFKTCDGLWKKLFAIGTADATKLTAISANSQSSYAAQKSGIYTSGVATGIFDKFLTDADPKIVDDPNAVIICTRKLADALMLDVRNNYKNNLEWKTIFDGFEMTDYFGIKVARCGIFDRMINTFENTGSKWNKPYRAVMTTIDNIRIGIGGDSVTNEFDVNFDNISRNVYLYATGFIGAAVVDSTKVHLAY